MKVERTNLNNNHINQLLSLSNDRHYQKGLKKRDILQVHESLFCGEQTCGCQGGGGWSGMDWEFGVDRCKLLPLE